MPLRPVDVRDKKFSTTRLRPGCDEDENANLQDADITRADLEGVRLEETRVPDRSSFGYTFDHLADVVDGLLDQLGITKFALYVLDFGGPDGYRLALRHHERLSAIIMQDAPLYPLEPKGWWETIARYWADGSQASREASRSYLNLEDLPGQYVHGVQDSTAIDPDCWVIDKALIDRPGVDEIMLDLLYDIHWILILRPSGTVGESATTAS